MSKLPFKPPRCGGRTLSLRAWVIAMFLLASTFLLVLAHGLSAREWACQVTFVIAEIYVCEAILANRRDD